jgi:TolA-binding protein
MKTLKLALVVLLGLVMITGCGKKKEQQILDLQAKNAQLVADQAKKDSIMNELFNSINDIERNLADITAREKLITDAPNDEKRMNEDVRTKIMDEIILINNIMEENKRRLASLKDQLKKSDAKIASLQETIQLLTKKMEEKEQEIAALKDELVRLNFEITVLNSTVDTLREQTASQSNIISQQDAVIGDFNTIWYVVGTKKELSDQEIIEKAGGLFNGDMVMSQMINPDYFTASDMRKISKISFESKKADLVTVHPEGSYKFIEENDMITGLEISNPGEFWKTSRFLVIMTR